MKRILLCVFAAYIVGVAQAQNHTVDEVVWVVGDEAILRSDVERYRNDYNAQVKGDPYCVIPEQLAIQKLFLHQAVIDSITPDESQLGRLVETELNNRILMAGSRERLEEYMRMSTTQMRELMTEQYRTEMIVSQVKQKLTEDVKITPAEVRKYYRDLPEDSLPYVPMKVEVQILVQHPRVSRQEIERVKEQLRGWAERSSSNVLSGRWLCTSGWRT